MHGEVVVYLCHSTFPSFSYAYPTREVVVSLVQSRATGMQWRCQQGFLKVAWAESCAFCSVGLEGYMVVSIGRVPSLL